MKANTLGVCLVATICGLVLAAFFSWPVWYFAPLLVVVFLPGLTRAARGVLLLSLVCLVVGTIRYPLNLEPDKPAAQFFAKTQGQRLRIHGRILAVHQRPAGGLTLDLKLLSVETDVAGRTRGSRLRLYLKQTTQRPLPGQEVLFLSRVRATRNFGTPGEFNFVRYLAYYKIWHTAYLANDRGLALLANASTGFDGITGRLRQRGLDFISQLTEPDASLLKALLLGEKGALPREVRVRLAQTGISHLFAISGLHLGLLAFFLYTALKFFYARFQSLLLWQPAVRVLWLVVLPPLFFYLQVTGDALATRRAFFVMLVVAFLCVTRRRCNPLHLLAGLAFLFLLLEPLALWQPSFLLSFSGAAGILWCNRAVSPLLQKAPRLLRFPLQLFFISFAASLATLPFVVLLFHLFSPAAVLNNLLAVPVVSFFILPLGLAGLLVATFSSSAGLLLIGAAGRGLNELLAFAERVTSLPGLAAQPLYLTVAESLALFLLCLGILLTFRYRWGLLFLVPAFLLAGGSASGKSSPELTLFSVGQGESMLLRVKGKNFLIDGGGLRSETFDVGERLLAPALGILGVKRLDAVILTHNHPDHGGGLAYIVKNFAVAELWTLPQRFRLDSELKNALSERKVRIRRLTDSRWTQPGVAKETGLRVRTAQLMANNPNDASICLFLPTSAGGLLLTGDLEAAGVDNLLNRLPEEPVSLLKVPHHGSAGSRPQRYLQVVRPRIAAVSAGYANSYGFPSKDVLAEAGRLGIEIRRTDIEGSLRFRVVDGIWKGQHWERGLFR